MLNLDLVRNETPALNDRIFLNSAGSSLMPTQVVESIKNYLNEEVKFGGYEVMELQRNQIQKYFIESAKLINCNPENIAFSISSTDGFAKAMSCFEYTSKDHILITSIDYVSNYFYCIALQERFGVNIHIIKDLESGDLDLIDLEEKIQSYNPKVVVVTHVPTNSGLVQDVEAIGDICAKYSNVAYLLDACQSMGQMVVDVERIRCDFLTTSGRKFMRGPRGTGMLYVSDRMLSLGVNPLSSDAWGSDWTSPLTFAPKQSAQRFEYFEKPFASMVGLGSACAYINELDIQNIEAQCMQVSQRLRSNLSTISNVRIMDKGIRKASIVTFVKEGVGKDESLHRLAEKNIVCGASERFSALVDFDNKEHDWAIRLSPHYFNTSDEIDRVSQIIEDL